jgi:hypothetical protein
VEADESTPGQQNTPNLRIPKTKCDSIATTRNIVSEYLLSKFWVGTVAYPDNSISFPVSNLRCQNCHMIATLGLAFVL